MYFPTVESLNAFNVVLSQWVACSVRIDGVHQGARVIGMGHPESVSQLVGCHYKQVVSCREKMSSVNNHKMQFSDLH